jgi:sarcosine oxidase
MHYDAIVIGCGGMGSAALRALALKGKRVLGIEQFEPGHDRGSSHGHSRIIRLAYNEHPDYVPLLRRAFELWSDIEVETGQRLFVKTGGLDIGPMDGRVVSGALAACRTHNLAHEWMTGPEIHRRFPGVEVPEHYAAVFHEEAGYLNPEACIDAMVASAVCHGAALKVGETLQNLVPHRDGWNLHTDRGHYTADQVIVTAGAWSQFVLPDLERLAIPERQVVGWFDSLDPKRFSAEQFPVFILDSPYGEYYGFPIDESGRGFKIGRFHHLKEEVDPRKSLATPDETDEAILRQAIEEFFPLAGGELQWMQTCMFTNSPDGHFIIDRHPDSSNLIVAAGFSGHGFKFACVVGELLAALACDPDASPVPLFAWDRFAQQG